MTSAGRGKHDSVGGNYGGKEWWYKGGTPTRWPQPTDAGVIFPFQRWDEGSGHNQVHWSRLDDIDGYGSPEKVDSLSTNGRSASS